MDIRSSRVVKQVSRDNVMTSLVFNAGEEEHKLNRK